jgi:sulfoxide reductase heme-binding subunit YedZ
MKQLREFALLALRGAIAAAALYAAYQLAPEFFAMWDTEQPLQWWAGRVTGFAAYGAIACSMIFGLMVSSRGMDGMLARRTVLEHHQQWTLSAVALSATHVIVIATDGYVDIGLRGALVPGEAAHMTGAVAIGTLALWGLALIVITSWLRAFMSFGLWRVIHATATGVFLLALTHGFVSGTDTKYEFGRVIYLGSGAAILGATVFRVLYDARQRRDEVVAGRPR